MGIEENDQVVTPSGLVCTFHNISPNGQAVCSLLGNEFYPSDLVKLNAPIRVRVSRECYAESLVEMAEEHGFEARAFGPDEISIPNILIFRPDINILGPQKKEWEPEGGGPVSDRQDLTYAQDLPQIEWWLEANTESEDGESGKIEINVPCDLCTNQITEKAGLLFSPPHGKNVKKWHVCEQCYESIIEDAMEDADCTDDDDDEVWIRNESDDSSKPRPEDDVSQPDNLRHKWVCEEHDDGRLMEQGYGCVFCNYYEISELQQELEDVRDKNSILNISLIKTCDERDNLHSRIEEAREWLQKGWDEGRHRAALKKALEILSPDSDEGDGCGAE